MTLSATGNVDAITDFSVVDDTIELENTGVFTALSPARSPPRRSSRERQPTTATIASFTIRRAARSSMIQTAAPPAAPSNSPWSRRDWDSPTRTSS
jgi:hypothetical protein